MCHSRENGNPVVLSGSRIKRGMTGGDGSRIKCGMTGGDGSPIRSALLSVEDDKRGQSVEDDKECVIPVKTGIQIQLDPQSEALGFRLRMTRGAVG